MVYPVYLPGNLRGTLTVEQAGLYTVYAVRTPPAEGLIRLAIYGGGIEAPLGLLTPAEDGMALTRRLSRAARQGFPDPIEYAAPAGRLARTARLLELASALLRPEPPPVWEPVSHPRRYVTGPLRRALFDISGAMLRREGDTLCLAIPADQARLRGVPTGEVEGRLCYLLYLKAR